MKYEDLTYAGIEMNMIDDAIAREEQIKLQLEIEESGRKIAYCQGEIAGIRQMFSFITESLLLSEEVVHSVGKPDFMPDIASLSDEVFRDLCSAVRQLQQRMSYITFESLVASEIERKKDFLFFTAEKARDIDFVHGFRDGLLRIRKKIEEVELEEKDRKTQMTLFSRNFDDE